MGCDIWTHAERKTDGGRELIAGLSPFDWRSYGMYGFLAGVRNYSLVPPISGPRGLPEDMSGELSALAEDDGYGYHSHSWLSLEELRAFDYDATFEDRRRSTSESERGEPRTFREFLGEGFFEEIDKLQAAGADRVVFWFDN